LGKKNWLFAGSERAGKRAAAIQTLLGTAKLNGLDPAAWKEYTEVEGAAGDERCTTTPA
jgi:hypothetical protein